MPDTIRLACVDCGAPFPTTALGARVCPACQQIRIATFVADPGPRRWWWLSFTDPHKQEGSRFLGVAVVSAANLVHAARVAHDRRINPGGEVAGVALPDDAVPAPHLRNRLLSVAELLAANLIEPPCPECHAGHGAHAPECSQGRD